MVNDGPDVVAVFDIPNFTIAIPGDLREIFAFRQPRRAVADGEHIDNGVVNLRTAFGLFPFG